ncbi:hypothetical protein ES703_35184 [subsurface metagenome]
MNGEYREAGYLEAKEYAGYAPVEYLDIVYLTDGRTIIGTIIEETTETITILTTEGEEITINREDITNITKSVIPPVGAIEPWLQKYGPWLLAGGALVFSIIALSRK